MRYAELHARTNFSFLEGASHPHELAERAAELGYAAWAATDRNSLAGVVRAHGATKDAGLRLIVGAEVTPDDAPPVVLWAMDRAGYGNLCRLLTLGRRRAPKGQCRLTFADLAEHSAGLIAGVRAAFTQPLAAATDETPDTPNLSARGAESGREPRPTSTHASHPTPHSSLLPPHAYRELFGDRTYLLAELALGADDARRLAELQTLSAQTGLPLVAAGDVYYHVRARQPLHEVLTAIRLGTTVAALGPARLPNAERHLLPVDEIVRRFAAAPGAVERTLEIVARCPFSLDELRYEYPAELVPAGHTPASFLAELTWRGAAERYPQGPPEKVRSLLEHELRLIGELAYEPYFLTVWDLVRFARSRGILCQGRGSAANSAVCYCLGVTAVDPDRTDLLFERFVSKERNEAPDIDIDFEHERREEVLQYLYDKYGRDRAGLTAVVIRYRARSAIRDVGKALGLSLDRVDALAKQVEGYAREDRLAERCRQAGLDPQSPLGARFVHLVEELLDFPRHLSQHVGGMVMSRGPLCELTPIENAAMPGRTVIQWDKDDLDELGLLKVDCLSLGMLTAIRKGLALVAQHHGRRLSPATIPPEDPAVYAMIQQADTLGVFQIESRAQMSMLPRLKPRCFYDLVIEVAIVRPGPIQGQMVHPYLRRRNGEEVPPYPSEAIRAVLHKTLGVPLFQEQAMRLAVVAAGFTPGEADQLRRAMGAWRRPGVIDQFRRKLIDGMRARGLSETFAEQVFNQIRGFGEYGFPESHAASFALLVYVSAWLKRYYPAAFTAAIINSQPMGFYAPAQLIRDARAHGVTVLPLDVNRSTWDCTLEPAPGCDPTAAHASAEKSSALRLGLRLVSGLAQETADQIVAERAAHGPFASLAEFTRRTGASRATLTRLADADVFAALDSDRRLAYWQALGQPARAKPAPLFAALAEEPAAAPELPPLSPFEQVLADYRTAGLSLKGHPLAFVRDPLSRLGAAPAEELARLPTDRPVTTAGVVLLRQRPSTAKGITFVTLEDETGVINLLVRPAVWDRFHTIARRSGAWIATGELQRQEGVIHVIVSRLQDLSHALAELRIPARDFR